MNNSDENNRVRKKKEEVKEEKPKPAKKVDRKKIEKQEISGKIKPNIQNNEVDSPHIYRDMQNDPNIF
jgi:hypothetical protein